MCAVKAATCCTVRLLKQRQMLLSQSTELNIAYGCLIYCTDNAHVHTKCCFISSLFAFLYGPRQASTQTYTHSHIRVENTANDPENADTGRGNLVFKRKGKKNTATNNSEVFCIMKTNAFIYFFFLNSFPISFFSSCSHADSVFLCFKYHTILTYFFSFHFTRLSYVQHGNLNVQVIAVDNAEF